ncbi:hypothetical protein [Sorangium sp. So ce1151]|uniref:hypothetical protein n=1 Tax=Sorangium sp. So ce1151 TaxID=3133332 RepID=UPI003F5FA5BC
MAAVERPQGLRDAGGLGTSAFGVRARYSGVFVIPKAAPESMRSKGRCSSCAVNTTLRTSMEEMRPHIFSMAWS